MDEDRPSPADVLAGQAVYNRWTLAAYDVGVLGLSCTLLWRCPSSTVLAAYERCLAPRHLEIGPGTGYFLDRAAPPTTDLTLLDLNATVLQRAGARLARMRPRTVLADALEPLPGEPGTYDSVGMNFVLHCLPGGWGTKGAALHHAAAALRPGGRLFGSTILGRGVPASAPARALMAFYNARGIFSNTTDDVDGLHRQLAACSAQHQVVVQGCVALFEATT